MHVFEKLPARPSFAVTILVDFKIRYFIKKTVVNRTAVPALDPGEPHRCGAAGGPGAVGLLPCAGRDLLRDLLPGPSLRAQTRG